METEELLKEIIAGIGTLDKQEIVSIVCEALKIERIKVRYVPQDLINYGKQMCE